VGGDQRLANGFRFYLKAKQGCHIRQSRGAILCRVNVSFFGAPHAPAYAAVNYHIISLTKSLAISFAPNHIRVDAIAPGWIKTQISRSGRESPEFNARVVARLLNREWAESDDLAGTAIFLVGIVPHQWCSHPG
jgi:NAD(P)-dependent dehydrogenase (short-subunit alcohol dehydrogenase family)